MLDNKSRSNWNRPFTSTCTWSSCVIRKNARIKLARSFCNAGRRCISFRFLLSRTSGYCYLLRRRHFPLACRRYVVPGLCKMADVPMSPHINVPKGGKFFHTGISISDSTSHECIAMHLLVPCVGSRRKYSSTDTRIFDLQVPVFRLASPLTRHSKLLRSVKQSSFSDCFPPDDYMYLVFRYIPSFAYIHRGYFHFDLSITGSYRHF